MAAARCAGSASGLGQQTNTRPGSVSNHRHVRCLTLEEARCPVCLEILLEPVTMPCRHSVCLHCFKRTVECSGLCCPSCRLRVSSWARNKLSREKSLVNTELWDMVRQSYPEKCGRRLEQRDRVKASEDGFCSPVQIRKPGEMRNDYDKQKNKMKMDEETEERMKKCLKKGECGLQHSQDTPLGVLSDSENEEPMRMRTRHASAFVRRSRFSPAFCRSLYTINVQRSQSCTDSEEGRRKVAQPHLSLPEKVSVCHSFNAGILLSSENSRSFSAPVLPLDKRHFWHSILTSPPSSLVPHTKPERSVSPESNDSISEELNHFKPIVCSPCTPPKRLPDGRLMEPTIVKSTPRNLTHGLQKSTSYEASPSILQKWKQVELDRQRVKFMSKGTITSPVADDYSITQCSEEDQENKSCNCGPMEKGLQGPHCSCSINTNYSKKQRGKSLLYNKRQLIFDQCSRDDGSQSTTAYPTFENMDTYNQCGACEPHSSPLGKAENLKSPIMDKRIGVSHNQGIEDLQDLKNEPNFRSCVLNRPTSRKGRKRRQKTKHLEESKRIKIFKIESCDSCDPQCRKNEYVERLHQERMDRELAIKLQRQFDKEGQKVERHRMSSDKYPLRSWICVDGRAARNPRRSGRISRKIKHFNLKS
ncbi:E3 ubiquitin-protein ligase RNF169 [Clarias gariepinus]|uniref:E3 ubiquitin-protein ligase RNF169 n=1 Tax=Clarias gariepinus TaxID=13013 RepID=UPI00234C325A|nr:E3 ubiquitin-protein ligase RNF169 [Clarias gariepinus]